MYDSGGYQSDQSQSATATTATTYSPTSVGNTLNALLPYLTEAELAEIDSLLEEVYVPPWLPLPGPQTLCLLSKADETFYGGAAGGGKTDLLIGAALTDHWDSIIFRREFAQLKGIRKRSSEIYHGLGKFNGGDLIWRLTAGQFNGKTVELGACQNEGDEQKYQGRPHDLKGFDEITHFTEDQFRFLKGWNRTTRTDSRTGKTQRTRVIAAGNPPVNAEGQWVVRYWAPWLDPRHPNPAKPGELRWFITNSDGDDEEVADNTPILMVIDGVEQLVDPISRTFIRAKVQDNEYLMRSGYQSVLQALPEPLRSRMLGGNFSVIEDDKEWQVIPSDWIMKAQARWAPSYSLFLEKLQAELHKNSGTKSSETAPNAISLSPSAPSIWQEGPSGVDLSCLLTPKQLKVNADQVLVTQGNAKHLPGARDVGVDVARGGKDKSVVSERIGSWFAELKTKPGVQTSDGTKVIDWLVELGYKDWRCKIDVVGVGSSPVDAGKLRNMEIVAMNGSEGSLARDRSNTLSFTNQRAEWWWLFREALDPELGLNIALPPDPELAADLAAPTWTLTARGIQIEEKKAIKKRIMRSPDRGDAVVNAFAQPNVVGQGFMNYYREQVRLAKEQGNYRTPAELPSTKNGFIEYMKENTNA